MRIPVLEPDLLDEASLAEKEAAQNAAALSTLWQAYKDTGDRSKRDRLIVHYAPLVKYVAGRVRSGLPNNVEAADLVSYGMFGLIDAIDKFDISRQIKFETYAINRIRGAIIDELRSLDWVPRSVRSKAKVLERAHAELEAELKRAPTEAEIADRMGLTREQLAKLMSQVSFTNMVALDEVTHGGSDRGDKMTLGDLLEDPRAPDPEAEYETEEMKVLLAEQISGLPEREKVVLTLYYYERLTLAEIGSVLGVTESRVSQIHSKSLLDLRARLTQIGL
ncbi:MAG: RNA polymerase sigma factor WhiG [Actinobacteria bacterium]|jgi:RNA polymerase sigma factor for flagellar operon FliA|nr:RNA polymerase sigma factor WhiG [Micrococcales bacterium]MCB0903336.1 RNA polymerase sigma factor WhiG [Actinomycetota bacterium]MCO5300286.1 RNA polymerase sigma factor WhiG [Candidatus Nanopelagicales bacterium]MCB9428207.1 RNA polymerase sigma factor WhiG [Actinomycetota bacterium]HPE10928.1 RNA polymerase sigma factor WhiG [Actinomycetota bacterium]